MDIMKKKEEHVALFEHKSFLYRACALFELLECKRKETYKGKVRGGGERRGGAGNLSFKDGRVVSLKFVIQRPFIIQYSRMGEKRSEKIKRGTRTLRKTFMLG